MSIMKFNILDEYCTFLFTVLNEHEKRIVDSGWCINIEDEKCYSRVPGYLGEILMSIFIMHYESKNPNKVKYLYQLMLWN